MYFVDVFMTNGLVGMLQSTSLLNGLAVSFLLNIPFLGFGTIFPYGTRRVRVISYCSYCIVFPLLVYYHFSYIYTIPFFGKKNYILNGI